MRAPTPALVEQVDRDLLEHAGADAAEHVVGAALLEDDVVDAGLGQQGAEQQAGRAGADDRDLGPPRGRHGAFASAGRACQSASSSASRARLSLPRRRGSSSGGRPSSITAATVCSSGRVVSRVCSARWMSTREKPWFSGSVEGSQSGSSLHGSTPRSEEEVLGHGHRLGGRRTALLGFVLAGGNQLAPAAGRPVCRPGAVEGAALAALDQADDPGAEVAHVDELQRLVIAQVGHQHLAAFEGAPRPVAEAAAAVAGPDDQAGTDDQGVLAEYLQHLGLAGRLLRPVVGEVAVGGIHLREVGERVDLADRRMARRGVCGDAGDEAVALDILSATVLRRTSAGDIAAGVDDRVEALPREGEEIAGAVADDRLHAPGQALCARPRLKTVSSWPRSSALRRTAAPRKTPPPRMRMCMVA